MSEEQYKEYIMKMLDQINGRWLKKIYNFVHAVFISEEGRSVK